MAERAKSQDSAEADSELLSTLTRILDMMSYASDCDAQDLPYYWAGGSAYDLTQLVQNAIDVIKGSPTPKRYRDLETCLHAIRFETERAHHPLLPVEGTFTRIVGANPQPSFLGRLYAHWGTKLATFRAELDARSHKPARPKRGHFIRQALLVLGENPHWTNKQVADEVGCTPSNLSQSPVFKRACANMRIENRSTREATHDPRTQKLEYHHHDEIKDLD